MRPLRAVVIGSHDLLPCLLDTLKRTEGCNLVGLITREDDGEQVDDADGSDGFDILRTESLNGKTSRRFLKERDVDIGICLGWYEIIESDVLRLPRHGIIGIHAAPLPAGRGQAPVNWQLILGYGEATASIFEFTAEVDAGPIYDQCSIPILENETVDSLYDRLMYFAIKKLSSVINELAAGESSPRAQTQNEATYWPRRYPKDSLIDWALPATRLERFVRALVGPYPHAFTYFDERRIEVTKATETESLVDADPGEIVSIDPPSELVVQTGEGALAVRRMKEVNSPAVTGIEYAQEHELEVGNTLGGLADFPPEFSSTALRGPDGREQLVPVTNIAVGETVLNHGYCFFPRSDKQCKITATVNSEPILQEERLITGHECIPIEFEPTESGAYFLQVHFSPGTDRTTYIYVGK